MPNRLPQHLSFQASLLALLLLGGNFFSALPSSLPWIPQPVSVGSSDAAARCGPLPPPAGWTIVVADESALWGAVNEAVPGTTILIEDGTYHLGQKGYYLWIDTPGITLRSKSGNREAVVLDDAYARTEVITVAASNVTIADLSIHRAKTHPIHVVSSPGSDTLNTRIYNVHIVDPGQQGIKINPDAAKTTFPDDGEIACSQIELTDAGRAKVLELNGSCYTGGIDGHQARGWEVRDNRIEGFWCAQGLSEHAVHFWTGSRDTLVERNVLVDNARGVGFGLLQDGSGRTYTDQACPGTSGYVDHYLGIIRNNFIFAGSAGLFASQSGFDCGICLWQACGAQTVHNTVVSLQAPFSSIEWRFPNARVEIINNLVSHGLRQRDGASAAQAGNLQNAPLSLFVNAPLGDLHLVSGAAQAIDQGTALPAGLAGEDIDGDSRPYGAKPDIGADEFGVSDIVYTDFAWLPLVAR